MWDKYHRCLIHFCSHLSHFYRTIRTHQGFRKWPGHEVTAPTLVLFYTKMKICPNPADVNVKWYNMVWEAAVLTCIMFWIHLKMTVALSAVPPTPQLKYPVYRCLFQSRAAWTISVWTVHHFLQLIYALKSSNLVAVVLLLECLNA